MEEIHQYQNPLGTENIGKLIRNFSIPAIISLLVNAIYNIADQVFIGMGIGMLGIAATNVAFPIVTISTAIALLLGVGGASNFNLNLGRKEHEKASYAAGNSLSLMVIFGVVYCIISIVFVKPLLVAFGSTQQVLEYAVPFTSIISIGIPFMIFTTGACNMIRADGSPRYSMVCLLSGAIFTIIFDPIFIFVLKLGIRGPAIATVLGQFLSASIAFIYIIKHFKSVPLLKKHFIPKKIHAFTIFSLGAAACINQIALTVVQIAMNNTLRYYGALSKYGSEIPLAAVGAISKVAFIYMAIAIGIAQGCQPIVGFNYGAKNYGRVKKAFKIAVTSATIVSVITFLIFEIFPRQIIGMFGNGSKLYFEFAIKYLRIYMLMTFINGIQPVTANFFTSIGKAKLGVVISLTRQIIFLLPLILILPIFFGIDGVVYTAPISDLAAAILAFVFIVREFRLMSKMQKKAA